MPQVHDDELGCIVTAGRQRGDDRVALIGLGDDEALVREQVPQDRPQRGVVIGDQNSLHRWRTPIGWELDREQRDPP
jgi:hypothetical protein